MIGTPRFNSARTTPSGFSLLELVVVLAVITVVSSIAIPRYASALSRYRVETAAHRLVRDYAYAAARARATSAQVMVLYDVFTDSYIMTNSVALNDADMLYKVDLAAEPYRADITLVNFGGSATLIFDGYGNAHADGIIYLTAGGETRQITFNKETGEAVIQ